MGAAQSRIGRSGPLTALLIAAAVVAADQLVKLAVRDDLKLGEQRDLPLGFHLTRLNNDGVAFGLFDDGGALVTVGVTALGLVGIVLVAAIAGRTKLPWAGAATALIVAGAIGNLIDRIALGSVTDYLDPPRWPAFNLADAAISIGVFILVVALWRSRPEDAG